MAALAGCSAVAFSSSHALESVDVVVVAVSLVAVMKQEPNSRNSTRVRLHSKGAESEKQEF